MLGCSFTNEAFTNLISNIAMDAGSGKKVEKLYDIPYELVTKENADKYIGK